MKRYFQPKRIKFSKLNKKQYIADCKYDRDLRQILWNMSLYAIKVQKDLSPNLFNLGEIK